MAEPTRTPSSTTGLTTQRQLPLASLRLVRPVATTTLPCRRTDQARRSRSPSDTAAVKAASLPLEEVVATQLPVIPLLYGATWCEYSTASYTGFPTPSNPYMDPAPGDPELPYILAPDSGVVTGHLRARPRHLNPAEPRAEGNNITRSVGDFAGGPRNGLRPITHLSTRSCPMSTHHARGDGPAHLFRLVSFGEPPPLHTK